MFGIVAYLGECFAVSLVLTFLYVITRSVKSRDEIRSWRVFLGVYVFVLMLPFGVVELLTRTVGRKMESAVKAAVDDTDFDGKFSYYKVLFCTSKTARVIAVGMEKEEWGANGVAIIAMTLKKEGEQWKPDSFRFVQSDKRNMDGITFPPYW